MTYFTPEDLKALGNAQDEMLSAYRFELENRLWDAVLKIEGRMPSNDEIALRARRIVWKDGRVDWTWNGAIILTEPAPTL